MHGIQPSQRRTFLIQLDGVFPRATFYDLPHVSQSSVRHPEEISATGIRTAAFQITRNVLIKIEFKTFVSQAENVSNLDFKMHEKNFYFLLLPRRHEQSLLLVDVRYFVKLDEAFSLRESFQLSHR